MKTTTMKWALTVMVSSSILLSCKKESTEPAACEISLTGIAGNYKLVALEYKESASAAPVDYLSPMEDCEKDNILVLKSDGTYRYDDAGTACSPKGTEEGTWEVHGNTLRSDGTLNGTIASYDCKTLTYYAENTIEQGDRMTFTLVKQ
ncbi:MAG TPA: lipocalin family protein [Chitinophaga sp.]